MESRGARRFETSQIRRLFPRYCKALFRRARKFSFLVSNTTLARILRAGNRDVRYFWLPRRINAKIKSTLFHAVSPNGGRSSRREYFISTQPRIRYVAMHNCDRGRKARKKKLSLSGDRLIRTRSFPGNPLLFIVIPVSLSLVPSRLPVRLDTHEHRNKKPR